MPDQAILPVMVAVAVGGLMLFYSIGTAWAARRRRLRRMENRRKGGAS